MTFGDWNLLWFQAGVGAGLVLGIFGTCRLLGEYHRRQLCEVAQRIPPEIDR